MDRLTRGFESEANQSTSGHLAYVIVCLLCIGWISNAFHCTALLRFLFTNKVGDQNTENTEKKIINNTSCLPNSHSESLSSPLLEVSFLKEAAQEHLNARSSRIRLCDLNFLCIFILQQLYEFFVSSAYLRDSIT